MRKLIFDQSIQIEHEILFNIAQWEAIQGGSGHHVINSCFIIYFQSLSSRHFRTPLSFNHIWHVDSSMSSNKYLSPFLVLKHLCWYPFLFCTTPLLSEGSLMVSAKTIPYQYKILPNHFASDSLSCQSINHSS